MRTYNVKDIADMLHTNPETVRRWIRSGKLKADQTSRKDGNMVREDELYKFIQSTAKYSGVAAALAAANPFLPFTAMVGVGFVGAILTTLASRNIKNEADVRVLSADVERTLKTSISESEQMIERKKAAIAELQEEINKEQQQIKDYKMALEHLADALSAVKENEVGEVND